MFSSLFRGSDREQPQVLPEWKEIAAHVDVALKEIYASFRLAFAEGYVDSLPAKEFIKRKIFDAVWGLLQGKEVGSYKSLAELDEDFASVHAGLQQSIEVYCQQPQIQQLCRNSEIDEPLSDAKKEMLLLLAKQYHALLRTKFILLEIQDRFTKPPYAPDDCEQATLAFKQQCELVPDLIRDIDIDSYRYGYAEVVVQMNHKLVNLFHQAGYGQVDVQNIMPADNCGKKADHKFLPFYHELNQLLPSVPEMNVLVKQKPSPERNQQLQEAVISLELVRNLLRDFKVRLHEHHINKMQALQRECNTLRESIGALRENDKFHDFFQQLYLLVKALVNKNEAQGVLGLIPTGDEVATCVAKQSVGANLYVRNNGWNGAKSTICNHISKYSNIDKATNAVFRAYTQSRRVYDEAFQIIDVMNNDWLGSVDELINQWTQALSDTDYVIEELEGLINQAQNILGRSAESNIEYWKGFVKRHWWKGALLAVLPVGGGAAAGVFLLKSTVAAIGLPVLGVVLGGATGSGIGLAQDSKKPPPPSRQPQVQNDDVGLHSMRDVITRLFESEEDVIRTEQLHYEPIEEPVLFTLYDDASNERLSSDEGEDESTELSIYSRQRDQQIFLFGSLVPNQNANNAENDPNRIHTFTLE